MSGWILSPHWIQPAQNGSAGEVGPGRGTTWTYRGGEADSTFEAADQVGLPPFAAWLPVVRMVGVPVAVGQTAYCAFDLSELRAVRIPRTGHPCLIAGARPPTRPRLTPLSADRDLATTGSERKLETSVTVSRPRCCFRTLLSHAVRKAALCLTVPTTQQRHRMPNRR